MKFINALIRKYENICTVTVCPVCIYEKLFNSFFKRCSYIVGYRNNCRFKPFCPDIFNFKHIRFGKYGIFYFQYTAVFRDFPQNISVFSEIHACISYDFLTNSIKGRICNLCEKLAEITEKRRILTVKRWQRNITSH